LWSIADVLRGSMTADNFRDYMLSLLFYRYISARYESTVRTEMGGDLPEDMSLLEWYNENEADVQEFEKMMLQSTHYIIKPEYLWSAICELARTQDDNLLSELGRGFRHIEEESFKGTFKGLFSEINLDSEKLGKDYAARNKMMCNIISTLEKQLAEFDQKGDILGDAYEYLIGQFAAGGGKKAGEFYTPQQASTILSRIVTLDCQDPATGNKRELRNVLDFACGSGSLLLNVNNQMRLNGGKIGKIYGQEKEMYPSVYKE
jgi:type I restriction enzyme M protein